MRKFMINVNGKSYEVEVEEVRADGSFAPSAPVATQVAAPAPIVSAPAASAAPAPTPAAVSSDAIVISSPMPGTILDVKVKVGESVKEGQVLCILEAMKMENEIMAPKDGTVVAVSVQNGTSVNNGDPLISLS